jgi:hypothetical protein
LVDPKVGWKVAKIVARMVVVKAVESVGYKVGSTVYLKVVRRAVWTVET